MWRFLVYVNASGKRAVQEDIDRQTAACKEHFRARVRYLACARKNLWKKPEARKLSGIEGIYEIRFIADRRQVRPLGFFGPAPNEFTILIWSTKKSDDYSPREAIQTSQRRKKEIERGEASCMPLKVDGEDIPSTEGV